MFVGVALDFVVVFVVVALDFVVCCVCWSNRFLIPILSQKNPDLHIKNESVTAGADATENVWLLCRMNMCNCI